MLLTNKLRPDLFRSSLALKKRNIVCENTNIIAEARQTLPVLIHHAPSAKRIQVVHGNSRIALDAKDGVLAILFAAVCGACCDLRQRHPY